VGGAHAVRRAVTDGDTPLICVVGATASGKSSLALALAEALGGERVEILGADSRQLYRGLDIGTAKPTPAERARVPHHLFDVLDPGETCSAGRYARMAAKVIGDIRARGRLPVVVGGTGLYVRALVDGIWDAPPRNSTLRAALEGLPGDAPHQWLSRLDPSGAAAIHPNDRRKLVRSLEITLLEGRPASALRAAHGFPGAYPALQVGLSWPREVLYARIDRRVEAMIEAGWVDEIRGLLDRGVDPNAPGMDAVGYRELVRHLGGDFGLEEAVLRIQKACRNYAKRQFTWFRKDARIRWLEAEGVPVRRLADSLIESIGSNQLGVRVDVSVRKAP
jgi:tRNA dimethylallyltransferase